MMIFEVVFFLHLLFFWCLDKAMPRDCGISYIFISNVYFVFICSSSLPGTLCLVIAALLRYITKTLLFKYIENVATKN